MMAEDILDTMLFALAIAENNTVGLTIFEDKEASTIYLDHKMAVYLAENIIHYALLLKES